MDHPIRVVATALLAGVIVGRAAPVPPGLVATAGVVVAAGVLVASSRVWAPASIGAAARRTGPGRRAWSVAAGLLALAAGVVIGTPEPALAPPPYAEVAWIEGVVRTAPPQGLPVSPERRESAARGGDDGSGDVDVPPRDIETERGAQDIAFDVRLPSGVTARVGLQVRSAEEIPELLPGDGVRILGRVRPREASANPGAVVSADPAGTPFRVDVDAAGPAAILRVPQALGAGDVVRRLGERLRRSLISRIRDACGDGIGGTLLVCALTGDRTSLPRDVARAFRDSGTAHLLAVSGLHLVLLTSVLGAIGRRVVPEVLARRLAVPATLAVVLAFTAACRFETPVVRAAAFVLTRAVARAVQRRSAPLDQLALAATAVVAWDPVQVFDPGFQLSFVAVAGLILLTRRIRDALFPDIALMLKFRSTIPKRRLRIMLWASSAIPSTVAAQCATAPVVAATFGSAQPAGFVANLFAVPAFAVLLPLAALLATLGPHGAILGRPSDLAAAAIIASLDTVASLPGATLALGRPPPWTVGLSAALLISSVAFRTWTRRHLLFPVASFAVLAAPMLLRRAATEIVVLDVGHGLCVLVRSGDGGAILYDAGGRATAVGDRVIVPALRELGVRRLDALILSHEDSDHIAGAEDVLHAFDVAEMIVSPGFGGSPMGRGVLDLCAERSVPVRALARGDGWACRGLVAEVLSPVSGQPGGAENAESLVLRLTAGDGEISVLLTGDVEAQALVVLADSDLKPVDVLVLPHHGRPPVDPQILLAQRYRARTLIASASDDERRLPSGAWSTGVRGAIRIRPGSAPESWPWEKAP